MYLVLLVQLASVASPNNAAVGSERGSCKLHHDGEDDGRDRAAEGYRRENSADNGDDHAETQGTVGVDFLVVANVYRTTRGRLGCYDLVERKD